jgi:hypothetical protein
MIPGAEPYGNDRGVRIAYTNLSHISRLWKASTQVNGDADMGIDVKELKEKCKIIPI